MRVLRVIRIFAHLRALRSGRVHLSRIFSLILVTAFNYFPIVLTDWLLLFLKIRESKTFECEFTSSTCCVYADSTRDALVTGLFRSILRFWATPLLPAALIVLAVEARISTPTSGRCCRGNVVLTLLFLFNASFYTFIVCLRHTSRN